MRYGVAPDHPEVKSVQNDFTAVAEDERVSFFGNVKLGTDVQVQELLDMYDGVILAYGAGSDRKLSIPGEYDGNGVLSARSFVNWYNGHPDYKSLNPNLNVENVVIMRIVICTASHSLYHLLKYKIFQNVHMDLWKSII